jgi:hypothetical protein
MNRPTLFALIALNTLFVFVLAGEWFTGSKISDTVTHESKTVETQDEELPSLDLEAKSEDEYSDLVERPLFIKGRKPVLEPETESAPVAEVKRMEAFVWNLTGVFTTPKGVTAFFSRINGKVEKDNYRKLQLGGEIDGWKLSEIHPDKVMFTQTGETKILPLRKAKPKNLPPTPAVPVVNANQNTRQQPSRSGMAQLSVPAQGIPAPALQMPETVQPVEQPADETDTATQQQ